MGNGRITVKYPANGEASDYMLKEHGIYAVSPELGTSDPFSNYFYMNNFGYVQDICKANHPWIFYMIKMLHPSLKLELDGLRKSVNEVREIDLVVLNEGLSDLISDTIKVQANMTLFSKVAV